LFQRARRRARDEICCHYCKFEKERL
jgi:hypothetical protein